MTIICKQILEEFDSTSLKKNAWKCDRHLGAPEGMPRDQNQQARKAAFRCYTHPPLPLTCFLFTLYAMLVEQTNSTLFCSCLLSVSLFIFLFLDSFFFHFFISFCLALWLGSSFLSLLTTETVFSYLASFLYLINSTSSQNFIYSPSSLLFTPFIYFSISIFSINPILISSLTLLFFPLHS